MHKTSFLSVSLVALLLMVSSAAQARGSRAKQLPDSTAYCDICHIMSNTGTGNVREGLNVFGLDINSTMIPPPQNPGLPNPVPISFYIVDWPGVCYLDSDRDGFTNGEELGDPNCEYKEGQSPKVPRLSLPYDASSIPPYADTGGCSTTRGEHASNVILWVGILAAFAISRRMAGRSLSQATAETT